MSTAQLAPARIARLFTRITTPAAASRASHRVYQLAHQAGLRKALVARRLYDLSNALNEHRHVLLAGFRTDAKAVSEHLANRDELARSATRPISGGAYGGAYGGNHEQLRGFNLWAELHRDNYWYVVDGLDGAGAVLSGPHGSSHVALLDAASMIDTSGT